MKRGGLSALALLVVLALPSAPETKTTLPDLALTPPLLEAEAVYPSPLRTALEVEARYDTDVRPSVPRGSIALTFDTEIPRGGEARQTVNEILDVLREAHVHATFFVVGTWARANRDVLRRIAEEGHEIANHSSDHRHFARRRAADVRLDLARVADLVASETGRPIAPLFRPPYGCLDPTAARAVRTEGYAVVGWTAAGADAEGDTDSPRAVVASLERDLVPGAVVLLHTNRWITAAALPAVLDEVRARGLSPVVLSALLEQAGASRAELESRASRSCS